MHGLFETIEPYLKNVKLLAIASFNTQPWIATVFYCYDEELNLYFLSRLVRRHSQEILKNAQVAVAIADQNQIFGNEMKGLQIEGTCMPLSGEEARNAFAFYKQRFPKVEGFMPEEGLTRYVESFSKGEIIHRIWKVIPTKIKIFDESKYGDMGKEFVL